MFKISAEEPTLHCPDFIPSSMIGLEHLRCIFHRLGKGGNEPSGPFQHLQQQEKAVEVNTQRVTPLPTSLTQKLMVRGFRNSSDLESGVPPPTPAAPAWGRGRGRAAGRVREGPRARARTWPARQSPAISGRCGRTSLLVAESSALLPGGRPGPDFTLSLTAFLPNSCTTSCCSERATPSRPFLR